LAKVSAEAWSEVLGDHRDVVRRGLDCRRVHALGEETLGVGWDRLVAVGDQVPGRERLSGRHAHHFAEG
jgi:hypothetical protein